MNKQRGMWIGIGIIIILAALATGIALAQSSVEEILVDTFESMEAITDAHAIVAVEMDSLEKNATATLEMWARRGEAGPGAFRLVVMEASEEDLVGMVMVSDGESFWAYNPAEGEVIIGTLEEARNWIANKDFEMDEFDPRDYEHPEDPESAVAKLLEYFKVEKKNTEVIGDRSALRLEMVPIPDQMPAEYAAVGGLINLWIDEEGSITLAVEYTGGSVGEFRATGLEVEINSGLEDELFTFDVPAGVEVVPFVDLEPKSLSLEGAEDSADFVFLTPSQIPEGATLVDVLEVQDMFIQRYTLMDGGSFTVGQGSSDGAPQPSAEKQPVLVRGITGTMYMADDGGQVLLTWQEGDAFYYIAGNLSADQALKIAESMQ